MAITDGFSQMDTVNSVGQRGGAVRNCRSVGMTGCPDSCQTRSARPVPVPGSPGSPRVSTVLLSSSAVQFIAASGSRCVVQ